MDEEPLQLNGHHEQQYHQQQHSRRKSIILHRTIADVSKQKSHYVPTTTMEDTTVEELTDDDDSDSSTQSNRTCSSVTSYNQFGLFITLENNGKICKLEFVEDSNFESIHPNVYGPACLKGLKKLGGGGSGVTIFSGAHPTLGNVVMKHGNDKDLKELFALATIAQELKIRGKDGDPSKEEEDQTSLTSTNTSQDGSAVDDDSRETKVRFSANGIPAAPTTTTTNNNKQHLQGHIPPSDSATYIRERIPEFRFIYISPNHLGIQRRMWFKQIKNLGMFKRRRNLSIIPDEDDKGGEAPAGSFSNSITLSSSSTHNPFASTASLEDTTQEVKSRARGNPRDFFRRGRKKCDPAVSNSTNSNANNVGQIHIYTTDNNNNNNNNNNNKDKNGNILKPCSVEVQGDSLCLTCSAGDCSSSSNTDVEIAGKKCVVLHNAKDNSIRIQLKNNKESGEEEDGDGYSILQLIVSDLLPIMAEYKWKFTFGQKTIGGEHPQTGNSLLYQGMLNNNTSAKILDTLITQYIQVIYHLENLTLPKEKKESAILLQTIRKEINTFEIESKSESEISKDVDTFMGNALLKNVHPKNGRFIRLMFIGKQFREYFDTTTSSSGRCSSGSSSSPLILQDEELLPSKHLGTLLKPGAVMDDVFVDVSPYGELNMIENTTYLWRKLLRLAVQSRSHCSPFAFARIWTCGLTDGGLHNLFLSTTTKTTTTNSESEPSSNDTNNNDSRLWLFDLGEPQLYSPPGFLTKFLFSFFHTLGMEETEDGTTWINRFKPAGSANNMNINGYNNNNNCNNPSHIDKLQLTDETKDLLIKAYDAFSHTLDRIIDELFNQDDGLRWLLVQYVILQLYSDASFCIQRWLIKGGGRDREENHQTGLDKWLWRALWDIYIAYDLQSARVCNRMKIENPSNRDSFYDNDSDYNFDDDDEGDDVEVNTSSRRGSIFGSLDDYEQIEESTSNSEEEQLQMC